MTSTDLIDRLVLSFLAFCVLVALFVIGSAFFWTLSLLAAGNPVAVVVFLLILATAWGFTR